MAHVFSVTADPSIELCHKIAALNPANPFYTPAYLEFRRRLGFQPWILLLRDDRDEFSACPAFLKTGHLSRYLEIVSLPSLPKHSPFWEELSRFCREQKISVLSVNTFASSQSDIPSLGNCVERRARHELYLSWDRKTCGRTYQRTICVTSNAPQQMAFGCGVAWEKKLALRIPG